MARWRDPARDAEDRAVEAAAKVTGWHPGTDPELRELVVLLARTPEVAAASSRFPFLL